MVFSSIASLSISSKVVGVPRYTAAALITAYQRYLSPLKGYSCAHRVLHHGESCSQYVKRTILERGLSDAWPQTQQRFRDCRSAYLVLMAQTSNHEDGQDDPGQNGKESEDNADLQAKQHEQSKSNPRDCPASGCNSSNCPDPISATCCLADLVESMACDAGALDLSACDLGGCDLGACGGCDVGAC